MRKFYASLEAIRRDHLMASAAEHWATTTDCVRAMSMLAKSNKPMTTVSPHSTAATRAATGAPVQPLSSEY